MKRTTRRGIAVVVLLPGILTIAVSAVMISQGGLLGFCVGPVVILLGTCALQAGRKLWAATGDEMLADDPRPPILLLRSFSDDGLRPATSGGGPLSGWTAAENETFEEMLGGVLQAYGPLIAIGRPGEVLRPLGAARMYVSHQDWRQRVDELLARCQLAVMIVGQIKGEDGLAWEVRRLLEVQPPEKVLLVFPPLWHSTAAEKELEARWEQYVRLGGARIPPYRSGAILAKFTASGNCELDCSTAPRHLQLYRWCVEEFLALTGRQPIRGFEPGSRWKDRLTRGLVVGSILGGLTFVFEGGVPYIMGISPAMGFIGWWGVALALLLGAAAGWASKSVG